MVTDSPREREGSILHNEFPSRVKSPGDLRGLFNTCSFLKGPVEQEEEAGRRPECSWLQAQQPPPPPPQNKYISFPCSHLPPLSLCPVAFSGCRVACQTLPGKMLS